MQSGTRVASGAPSSASSPLLHPLDDFPLEDPSLSLSVRRMRKRIHRRLQTLVVLNVSNTMTVCILVLYCLFTTV